MSSSTHPITILSNSNVMQAYNATTNESLIPPPQAPIAPPTVLPPSLVLEHKLQKSRNQIAELQKEQIGHNDEIVLAHVRVSTLEMIIEDIQVCHRADMKSLLDKIRELKNHKGGPPGY
ncbi:hypothetical protein Tco_1573758 [Tanacetum coccineum]